MSGQPVGLKEWAVAVKALEEGRQIIVLRKGGIAEETKDFRLESPSFYLFPTFEHQRPELVKDAEREVVEATKLEASQHPGTVALTAYAEVAEDIEVTDSETLDRLNELHIWTSDYAEERLKWKKTKPLHVLLLRVYRLDKPVRIPMRDSYNGCRSWMTFEDRLSQHARIAVLDDLAFADEVDKVKAAIKGQG